MYWQRFFKETAFDVSFRSSCGVTLTVILASTDFNETLGNPIHLGNPRKLNTHISTNKHWSHAEAKSINSAKFNCTIYEELSNK